MRKLLMSTLSMLMVAFLAYVLLNHHATQCASVKTDTAVVSYIEELTRMSNSGERMRAVKAIRSLTYLNVPEAHEALMHALQHKDKFVRFVAVDEIRNASVKAAVPALLQFIDHRLNEGKPASDELCEAIETFALLDGKTAAPYLIGKLKKVDVVTANNNSEQIGIIPVMINALGVCRNENATMYLMNLVNDNKFHSWLPIIYRALGNSNDPRAIDLLMQASETTDHSLKCSAISALASYTDNVKVADLLLRLSDSSNIDVSIAALYGLRYSHRIETKRKLASFLFNAYKSKQDSHVGAALVVLIEQQNPTELLVDTVSMIIVDENSSRSNIFQGIAVLEVWKSKHSAPVLKKIVHDNKDWKYTVRALKALEKIADEESFEIIATMTQDENPYIRRAAVSALKVYDINRSSRYLKEMLLDKYPIVRAEAIKSLGSLGDETASRLIRERYPNETDTLVRSVSLEAFGKLKDKSAVGYLVQVFTTPAEMLEPGDWNRAIASLEAITGKNYALQVSEWNKWYNDTIVQ